MTMLDAWESTAAGAMRKFDDFLKSLEPDERDVIAQMVRQSVAVVSNAAADDVAGYMAPDYALHINEQNTPTLYEILESSGAGSTSGS